MSDEVIEELWQIKDDMASEHGYDLRRLAADLRHRQTEDGRRVVDLRALRQAGQRPHAPRSIPSGRL